MFLSKLLVRIRGELLNLRERFAENEELRAKAEDLPDRIEGGMGDSIQGTYGQDSCPKTTLSPEEIGDLENEFNELLKQKKADQSPTSDQSPGNPRTLGQMGTGTHEERKEFPLELFPEKTSLFVLYT